MVKSPLGKQLLGAVAGMAIASGVYFATLQSFGNVKGYLVQVGENISDNVGVVSVNDRNPDQDTLRRIASRAQAVKKQLIASETDPGTPQTAINQNAEGRKATRLGTKELAIVNANPTEYQGTKTPPATEEERLAQRAAGTLSAMQAGHAGAPLYQPSQAVVVPTETTAIPGNKPFQTIVTPAPVPAPEPKVIIKEVPVPVEPKVIIKEVRVPAPQKTIVREVIVQEPAPPPKVIVKEVRVPAPVAYGKNLPDSGPVLNAVLLLSAIVALAIIRPDLKDRLIALTLHRS